MNKFKPYYQKTNIPYALISCILVLFLVVGITLAFFFDNDSASQNIQMSGQVRIEAVGEGDTYSSIEDTSTSSNLVIKLQDDYPVLVPNMEMEIYANCKVYKSNSKPLLRAKMELILIDMSTSSEETNSVIQDIYDQFTDIILFDDDWVKYKVDDGATEYFYYIGNVTQTESNVENYLLQEIDVTDNDMVVHFIDEPIKFPSYVTSDYSGFGVQIKITFEAIQNYIPDDNGNQLTNTILNSQKIFSHFDID
ncbi:MAG: hypothetical protein ACI4PF_02040 [Christensenellales bacterium]